MTHKLYSIQVAGIKCTNCAGKIQRGLKDNIKPQEGLSKVAVNIIHQKVSVTVDKQDVIQKVVQTLKIINFPPIGQPLLISGGDKSERVVTFVYHLDSESQRIQSLIKNIVGVNKVSHSIQGQEIRLNVSYNSQIVKGRQIADQIAKIKPDYKVINQLVASFQGNKKLQKKEQSMTITCLLTAFLFIFNMVLPFTGQWYGMLVMYPQQFGIFTLSVILNILIGIYVMKKYSQHFIKNAFINYIKFNQTNMQTLIALGSLSAFALFFFFIIMYTLEMQSHQQIDIDDAIMQINDALTSASMVVLVVTIGKHFQNKIKIKINRITDQIFPQSTLFSNMTVQFVQLKNRRLMIKDKRLYDITLLQKNDVISLKPETRLLVDVTVLTGTIKAVQSAINGSQDIQIITKGGRIQSGSIIQQNQNNQALVQIQNVFENSILTQIGTQIKLAQNQQENGKSGIQQVCKTVANYFVKGVILLSIGTMLIWAFLIYSNTVHVDICNICWIFQRGIGVLVVSCPCALGLAVPSVVAIILNLATKSGILIKNNSVFENMKKTKVISFDKTGTLFTRIQKIQEHINFKNIKLQQKFKWQIISLIQKQIKHPLAQILFKQAFNRSDLTGTNYNYLLLQKPVIDKNGLISSVCSKIDKEPFQVLIGNKNLLKKFNVDIPLFKKNTDASTELFLSIDGKAQLAMILNTHSNLRPQAKQVVQKIQKLGKQVHILSGDSKESVQKLANYLNIPDNCLHGEQSAFNKMQWIKKIQSGDITSEEDNNKNIKKAGVLMVGDGLNDIPCLQQAAIGVSINAKSQLNINAADVVILSQNLHKILALLRLLKRGNQFIVITLLWAFSYNIIMMPIVAGAFYSYGIYLSPVWSSISMSSSSISVVLFSQLLLCFNYDDTLKKGYEQKDEKDKDKNKDKDSKKLIDVMKIDFNPINKIKSDKKGKENHQEQLKQSLESCKYMDLNQDI